MKGRKLKVDVRVGTPLMGSDFIPHRQLIVTMSIDDCQDMAANDGKAKVKAAILKAIEKKLDKLIGK